MASEHRVSCFEETALAGSLAGSLSVETRRILSRQTEFLLINYGTCPSGRNTFSPDCYKNSAAVSVPLQSVSQLANLKRSGTAVAGDQGWRYGDRPRRHWSKSQFPVLFAPLRGYRVPASTI